MRFVKEYAKLQTMEKAILKTLIYADIFDYPLKINEIHKWLIGKKATLRQVEKALGKLVQSGKCKVQSGYYFLSGNSELVVKRRRREKQSVRYLLKAKILCQILKVIPWIKLVGISGGLALNHAAKKDDIDLFVITSKNRLWISRLLMLGILSLIRQRRKVGEMGKKIAGKICLNTLLEEDKLEQRNKDIFVAHEVLQMKVLWQRGEIYSKYLMDNEWAFRFLPNWVDVRSARLAAKNRSTSKSQSLSDSLVSLEARQLVKNYTIHSPHFLTGSDFAAHIINYLENLAKRLQLKLMSKPKGLERIEDGALYFHPNDCRLEVLSEYHRRIKKLAPLDK